MLIFVSPWWCLHGGVSMVVSQWEAYQGVEMLGYASSVFVFKVDSHLFK